MLRRKKKGKEKIIYHTAHGGEFQYIVVDELPPEWREEFWIWMKGQTVPLIPEHPTAVYAWDFERWFLMKFRHIPTYFD